MMSKRGKRASKELSKPGKLFRNVLKRCLPQLVENLDFETVFIYMQGKGVLTDVILRDIRDQRTTTDKIRKLITRIQQRDVKTYEMFKACLVEAGQTNLKDMLEEQEENEIGQCTANLSDKDWSTTKREEEMSGDGEEKKKGHVMISYSWAQKNKALWIKTQVANSGYTIWIDEENMGRRLHDSMADAVERSHVVLLCMSRTYSSSENCRKEALYAKEKKKEIIALKVEDFKPDGWLGILVTDLIFYNFHERSNHDEEMKKLLQALDTCYKKN